MTVETSGADLMELAWAGFINYAITDERVLAQFAKETGISFPVATTVVDQLVDDATGRLEADIEKFVLWATERCWGVEFAPARIRETIAAAKAAPVSEL